jgi:hypothetical protein
MRNPNTVISKKTPHGKTLSHLTQVDEKNDRYYYYHATKGWRGRRTMAKDDKQLRKEREKAQESLLPTQN